MWNEYPRRMQPAFPDTISRHKQRRPGAGHTWAGRLCCLIPTWDYLQSSTLLLQTAWREGSSIPKYAPNTCFNFSALHGFLRNFTFQGPPSNLLCLCYCFSWHCTTRWAHLNSSVSYVCDSRTEQEVNPQYWSTWTTKYFQNIRWV